MKFIKCIQLDCSESVTLEDVAGDLQDLVGIEILKAEEVNSAPMVKILGLKNQARFRSDGYESETWTFYHFGTRKGYVTLRWYGTSNGYYSESVDFVRLK